MVDNPAADKYSVPVERIFQIHESPCKAVLAITGGGAEIIAELLRHGSGSATVLDAVIPYSTDALDSFLGRKPEKYCSEKTARLMAMVAYQRALTLSKGDMESRKLIGIGATCKLKAANEREGRKHEIHVSMQTACETGVWSLELTADRTREEEEHVAALMIFNVLARYCGVSEINFLDWADEKGRKEEDLGKIIKKYESVPEPVGDLLKQKKCGQSEPYETLEVKRINLKETEAFGTREYEKIRLVFPGSFDPCHTNHVFMAKLASEKLGQPVHFEISITNVDKPPIDYISLNQRLDSLRDYKNEKFMGGVCLTSAPLFLQKAAIFPDSTFIVGADTLNRIFDAKYYNGSMETPSILNYFKEKNIRFMVFRRKSVELHISPEVLEFCDIVPLEEYKDNGISSTEIRKKRDKQ